MNGFARILTMLLTASLLTDSAFASYSARRAVHAPATVEKPTAIESNRFNEEALSLFLLSPLHAIPTQSQGSFSRLLDRFTPLFQQRAEARGQTVERDADSLGVDDLDSLRRELVGAFQSGTFTTRFFRDSRSWELEPFLAQLVKAKWQNHDLVIRSRHACVSTGPEAYSVAIRIYQALQTLYNRLKTQGLREPFPVWLARWTVDVEAFDGHIPNLIRIQQAYYSDREVRSSEFFNDPSFREFFEDVKGGYRIRSPIRGWVHPRYIQLADARQLPELNDRPYDITFSMNTLQYLRSEENRLAVIDQLLTSRVTGYPHLFVYGEQNGHPLLSVLYDADGVARLSPAMQDQFHNSKTLTMMGFSPYTGQQLIGIVADPTMRHYLERMADQRFNTSSARWALQQIDAREKKDLAVTKFRDLHATLHSRARTPPNASMQVRNVLARAA